MTEDDGEAVSEFKSRNSDRSIDEIWNMQQSPSSPVEFTVRRSGGVFTTVLEARHDCRSGRIRSPPSRRRRIYRGRRLCDGLRYRLCDGFTDVWRSSWRSQLPEEISSSTSDDLVGAGEGERGESKLRGEREKSEKKT
ncbi:hypothetical protein L484_018694 [Morus notabilis]|uniref:Uncharacterized protein n=1 Tax=Morus notabilis TaxID=981085 RepID=W9RZ56_9ROSA|nr:hypothetical protein L484_018694 [Morus notabilis]